MPRDGVRYVGRLVDAGEADAPRKVDATSLDDYVTSGRARLPNVIKLDIEGAEIGALHKAHCD